MQCVPCRGGGWMWGRIQSSFSLQRSIFSCVSRKAKAESRGNRLLHFRISLSDNLIYTLKQGWAAMCQGGLRVCRFHSNQRLRWRISLISSPSVADSVLISDISCYIAFDCNDNLETLCLPFTCDGPILHQSHVDRLDSCWILKPWKWSGCSLIFCFGILLWCCPYCWI